PASLTVPPPNQCDRWAAPAGSGTTCSDGSPCSLSTCVNQLDGAAQVCCLQPGTYAVSSTLRPAHSGTASAPLVLRKDPAAPNPATKPASNTPCTLNAGRVTVQYTGPSWSFLELGGADGSARDNWVVEGIDFDLNGKNTGGIILPPQAQGVLLRNSAVHDRHGNPALRTGGRDAP